ncbi:unnamed protein product [Dibothriocephalus latus]|uniref:Uncharacterized protein n=1 Tax=Dibothriocephalus latus TaxID=60516 RepID=A0A3P7MEX2_DIBLA|nr:unnamed protein product [Dibothriocephalus latus]
MVGRHSKSRAAEKVEEGLDECGFELSTSVGRNCEWGNENGDPNTDGILNDVVVPMFVKGIASAQWM